MFRFIFLLFTLSLVSAGKFKFTDCGHGEVLEVRSPDCAEEECDFMILHKGKEYTGELEAISNQDSQRIHIEMFAKIGGVEVQIENGPSNGCIGMGITCPVKKGEKYVMKFKGSIPSFAPTLTSYMRITAFGDHGTFGCIKFYGEIKD